MEKTGYIYSDNSSKELCSYVEKLVKDSDLRKEFGIKAYKTMLNVWNAENASENFIKIVQGLTQNKTEEIKNGPCSLAEPIILLGGGN